MAAAVSAASRTQLRIVLITARRTLNQAAAPPVAAVLPLTAQLKSVPAPPTAFVWLLAPPLPEHTSHPRSIHIPLHAPTRPRPRAFYSAWLSTASLKARTALAEGEAWLESPDIKAGSIRAWAARGFAAIKSSIDPGEIMLGRFNKFCDAAVTAAAVEQQPNADNASAPTQPVLTTAGTKQSTLLPSEPFVLTLQYPGEIDSAHLRTSIMSFLSLRQSFHTRRLYLLGALLPFTLVATVLPGPNVFLAFCAFRMFGHSQARDGAKKLKALIQQQTTSAESTSVDTTPTSDQQTSDELPVPVVLELIPYGPSIASASLADLCAQLRLDLVEVEAMMRRWE